MKKIQKGFAIPLLIAIIAVIVIGGGVYYYSKTKAVTTPEKQVIKEDITVNSVTSNATTTQAPIKTVNNKPVATTKISYTGLVFD